MNYLSRPAPFSAYTTPEFWDDPHISRQMLVQHLDPEAPMASRAHATIDQSVAWLIPTLGLTKRSRVLDLGCGPGLYAERLARRGINVLGIDVSHRALAHAHHTAERENLPVTLSQGDYLHADLGTDHDAALLIYEDYCALSPEQRALLLDRVYAALRPGGKFLFDVASAARFDHVTEQHHTQTNLMDGFWTAEPYTGTHDTWTYPDLRLVLDHYTIHTRTQTREFWNWMHCLTPTQVTTELSTAGFSTPELYGDVTGRDYLPMLPGFATVTERS